MCIKPGVSLHSRTERVSEERLVGKIGVRELYQKALFCHQNQLGSSSLHFIKDKRMLIHADKKQLFDGSLSKEPIFFCNVLNGSCRFQNVSLLAVPLIMQLEQTLLALPRC